MSSRIAIIAGAGRFPFYAAQHARRQGFGVVVIGMKGWADGALAAAADAYEEVSIGQLGRLMERLAAHGIRQAIMAGKVTKEVLLDPRTEFDAEALGVLQQVREASVSALLGAIGDRLAKEGITLLDSSTFLKADLCPAGILTIRKPTAAEEEDIRIGLQAARRLAELDIGQTVVVKRRVIVAVEALEGTDAAIRRAHGLVGDGLVVVKVSAPSQDRRFDLPVIGADTLTTLAHSGVGCLAVEAGTTLLLERDALITAANAASLCIIGVTIPMTSDRDYSDRKA